MTEQKPSPRSNRRLLLGAAGAAGVLVGGLLVVSSSGPSDDVAVTAAPRSDRPVQTTVTVPPPSADAGLAPVEPLDPFDQIVTVPQAAQGQPQSSQGAAAPAASATASAQRVQTTPTTSPPPPAAAAPPAVVTPSPPAPVAPPAAPPAAQGSPPPVPTVSATAGPVPVAGPLLVCVNSGVLTCTATPAASSVSISASATVAQGAVSAPTLAAGACSNNQGVALIVNGGSAGTGVTSQATVTVNGTPTDIPISVPPIGPGGTTIISACGGSGLGVAPAPGSNLPVLGGLVGSLLQPLQGLLGGSPGTP